MKLSIVIPAFNEEENLPVLHKELSEVLKKMRNTHEIIIVDDGSTDRTSQVIKNLKKSDKNVKGIILRRNFGQTAAWDAGFEEASGDVVIVMDADLQNDPKDIPRLLEKMKEGYDVVSGWRFDRKDGFGKRIFSKFANGLRRSLTRETIHDSGCSLKAYKKEALKGITLHGEMHRYLPALLAWRGFRIGEIKVHHRKRKFGKTKYGVKRLTRGFLDLIMVKFWMDYSTRPIHFFGGIGLFSFISGTIVGAWLTIMKFFYGQPLSNRPLLLLAVLLVILGLLLFMFGVLADILIKIYFKDTSTYTIKEKI